MKKLKSLILLGLLGGAVFRADAGRGFNGFIVGVLTTVVGYVAYQLYQQPEIVTNLLEASKQKLQESGIVPDEALQKLQEDVWAYIENEDWDGAREFVDSSDCSDEIKERVLSAINEMQKGSTEQDGVSDEVSADDDSGAASSSARPRQGTRRSNITQKIAAVDAPQLLKNTVVGFVAQKRFDSARTVVKTSSKCTMPAKSSLLALINEAERTAGSSR